MKRLILVMAAVATAIGLGLYLNRPATKDVAAAETFAEAEVYIAEAEADITTQREEVSEQTVEMAEKRVSRQSAAAVAPAPRPKPIMNAGAAVGLESSVDTLVSPYAAFQDKQAVWKRLNETGQLDRAIAELEQRLASNPHMPEVSAALGQAYFKKCAQVQDVREQALLAMKADQLLETALQLDPSNWEARFTKTVAMSYWPAELNKGEEVIREFSKLIEQQESQTPQPHFARSYVWLGDQYRKAGYADHAEQVWQRGAALFPSDAELRAKLAAQP